MYTQIRSNPLQCTSKPPCEVDRLNVHSIRFESMRIQCGRNQCAFDAHSMRIECVVWTGLNKTNHWTMDWNTGGFTPGFYYFLGCSFVRVLPEDGSTTSWSQCLVALLHGQGRDREEVEQLQAAEAIVAGWLLNSARMITARLVQEISRSRGDRGWTANMQDASG